MRILDWRAYMPRTPWSIGTRRGLPSFVTLHYNGPAIPQHRTTDEWKEHLQFIAGFHIGPYLKADGIQYHYAVLPDGTVVWLRNDNAELWHCGNATGNRESIAVHFPLGGSQRPTDAAWQAFDDLFTLRARRYTFHREDVYGHRQWPRKRGQASVEGKQQRGQSACPGDAIMALLSEWKQAPQGRRYRTKYRANVREAPRVTAPVAWNGAAVLPVGFVFEEATPVSGTPFKGDPRWLHWPVGGFVHFSAIEEY